MGAHHAYAVTVTWPVGQPSGEPGTPVGTTSYTAYPRDHEVRIAGKPALPGSADPAYRGDRTRYNPEELFVASLAQCHMLWFLHLAAESGVVVREYTDDATGTMRVEARGEGSFTDVTLHPRVVADPGPRVDDESLAALHHKAHAMCFIARSVNFPVLVEPAPVRTTVVSAG
ncbi:OsmC family protein [Isoptericola variabilis]|uniref:OsmC family protein n=1 Tax=Isoptericola variabilis (strain 225) TaxID=743718 RepID=F6FUB5_ISOV2|nr:OsmC family protein [Isoptericola variabilis]AEG44243.1 OsmC family protein [Isoptericola variabilis 225]TWH28437.1 organic hydroperoxide reductase OsmC/OhrA [Isoptericola variabilis J7]